MDFFFSIFTEGPFQSDALLVPEGCLFDHIHNASRCWPFVRWNQTGAAACQDRSMQMRSFAMLLPCGISLFSGVEFVCCPKHFKGEWKIFTFLFWSVNFNFFWVFNPFFCSCELFILNWNAYIFRRHPPSIWKKSDFYTFGDTEPRVRIYIYCVTNSFYFVFPRICLCGKLWLRMCNKINSQSFRWFIDIEIRIYVAKGRRYELRDFVCVLCYLLFNNWLEFIYFAFVSTEILNLNSNRKKVSFIIFFFIYNLLPK